MTEDVITKALLDEMQLDPQRLGIPPVEHEKGTLTWTVRGETLVVPSLETFAPANLRARIADLMRRLYEKADHENREKQRQDDRKARAADRHKEIADQMPELITLMCEVAGQLNKQMTAKKLPVDPLGLCIMSTALLLSATRG